MASKAATHANICKCLEPNKRQGTWSLENQVSQSIS